MYAKNNEVPRKFDYPYQKQQRVSGELILDHDRSSKSLSHEAVQAIEDTLQKFANKKEEGK